MVYSCIFTYFAECDAPIDKKPKSGWLDLGDCCTITCQELNYLAQQPSCSPEAPFVDMICKPWVGPLERQVQLWIDPLQMTRERRRKKLDSPGGGGHGASRLMWETEVD